MRRKHLLLVKGVLVVWILVIYILVVRHPTSTSDNTASSTVKHERNGLLIHTNNTRTSEFKAKIQTIKSKGFHLQLDRLEDELGRQSKVYRSLLDKLRSFQKQKENAEQVARNGPETFLISEVANDDQIPNIVNNNPVIPILLIACNREAAVRRSLDLLLKYRPNQSTFPIIVSQDCGHKPTRDAILSYKDKIILIQQPDLSDITVPLKERKFRGYFLISRHYKWALNQIFHEFKHESVIVVEDDLDVSPDFYEYFSATYPILKGDPTLWCVSAWNDNGKDGLVDVKNGSKLLYRTDFFPGLGWMMLKDIWEEIGPKWPRSYWDDWMRAPEQRKDRACIRPELSRTRTFGKKGISNGLFYEKHLKYIHLNDAFVAFTKENLSYLIKETYDDTFKKEVQKSKVVSAPEVRTGNLPLGVTYRIIYHTKDLFKKTSKSLGLMDDFKAGVPRTGYQGVLTFFYNGRRIYLAPNNNWKGYDPSWS